MSDRTRLRLTIATAVVCGARRAWLGWGGWPVPTSTPAPSPQPYSSTLGTSGAGCCWTEAKADGSTEALCGDLTRRMVAT